MKQQTIFLTSQEVERVLVNAGINPDPNTWSNETLSLAVTILEKATDEKARVNETVREKNHELN